MGKTRKVNQLDYETGKVIRTFSSVREACDTFGINAPNIWHAIEKNNGIMPVKKLRFEYAEGRIYKTKRKIKQLDYDTGEFVGEYDNLETAAIDNCVSLKALEKAMKYRNGYMPVAKLRFEFI